MPIVAASCISHAPQIILGKPSELEEYEEYVELCSNIKRDIAKKDPELIVFVTNDHFDNFFLNNIPAISIGISEANYRVSAKDWGKPEISYEFPSAKVVADELLDTFLDEGIDIAALHHVTMGMDILVPTFFLFPEKEIPVLPIYINDYVNPRPRPKRAHEWGEVLGRFLEKREERIVLIGTGGLSHWTGVPGKANAIDEDFDRMLMKLITEGNGQQMADYSIETLLDHGQHELLNWICVLGALGENHHVKHALYAPFYDYVTGHAIVSFEPG